MIFNSSLISWITLAAEIIVCLAIVLLTISKLTKNSNPNSPLAHLAVFLGKSMEESTGVPSNMRWMNFFAELWWAPSIAFGYVYSVIMYHDLVVMMTGSLLGTLCVMLQIKKNQAVQGEK